MNGKTELRLPEPDQQQRKILKALGIKLPKQCKAVRHFQQNSLKPFKNTGFMEKVFFKMRGRSAREYWSKKIAQEKLS